MDRIVILGGGVGGTLTANLLARRLKRAINQGQVDVTLVDALGAHIYQPGFMYIAMGGEREERLARSERALLDREVGLLVDTATHVDTSARTVALATRL
jgi:sulfide:quinone oxidoreductase